MTTNIFELATREKLRVDSGVGKLSVEQLWNLPLTDQRGVNLNDLAVEISRRIKGRGEETFVPNATLTAVQKRELELDQLRLDVLKHIIAVRLEDMDKASKARATAQQKQKLYELLAAKENEAMASLSKEEIMKQLAELDA